jgi:hypothetical protein
MRCYLVPVIAISMAAAPVALEAQTPRAERGSAIAAGSADRGAINPAAHVLQHREALGLTLDQVSQLQQIQAQLEEQNRPLLEQLRAAAPAVRQAAVGQMRQRMEEMTPEQREQMRARMQEQRGQVMAGQREQMRTRMEEMTPEQRQQMRARMQEQRGQVMAGQREQMRTRMERMRNASPEERAALREEMQQQRRERLEELPAEQRQTLEARRRAMQNRAAVGMAGRPANPELRQQFEVLRPTAEQVQANTRQARERTQAVLTAQQQEQFRQIRQQQAQRVRERVGGRPGAGPMNPLRRGPGR